MVNQGLAIIAAHPQTLVEYLIRVKIKFLLLHLQLLCLVAQHVLVGFAAVRPEDGTATHHLVKTAKSVAPLTEVLVEEVTLAFIKPIHCLEELKSVGVAVRE